MLEHPLQIGPAEELIWYVAEANALWSIRREASTAVRAILIAETRRWVMRVTSAVPTLLHDYHTIENAIRADLPHGETPLTRLSTNRIRIALYRMAIERGYLDAIMVRWVVAPFVRAFRVCDSVEPRWTDFVSGRGSRESDQAKPHFGSIEEFSGTGLVCPGSSWQSFPP